MSKRIVTAKVNGMGRSFFAQGENSRQILAARLRADDPVWAQAIEWVKAKKRPRKNGIAIWVTP